MRAYEGNMKYIVYALIDPRTCDVFYVGKSCRGLDEAKRHTQSWSLTDANQEKCNFIMNMLAEGYSPCISVLAVCRNKMELEMRERVLIAKYRKEFCLFNKQMNSKKAHRRVA
jgi:hypothetical protein